MTSSAHSSDDRKREDDRVRRAVEGDAEALESLLERIGPEVRATLSIASHLKRELDADDVMQVTFLEAFLRIRALRAQSLEGFRSWLMRVAQNNLRDAIRCLDRDKRPEWRDRITRVPGTDSAVTLLGHFAAIDPSVSRALSEREAQGLVRAAVARLPRSYREVIESCDLGELEVAEVARRRGTKPGAVYMLRSRAHDRLRELLGGGSSIFPSSE